MPVNFRQTCRESQFSHPANPVTVRNPSPTTNFILLPNALRILTRYIVFDLLKVFLLTLTCMTAFLFVVLVGKEAVENGLGIVPVLRMLPYILPQAMQFAVPGQCYWRP